jgi:hypothetical protein
MEAAMTLSVIGAGFGRTGTLSLKIALEQLGLGRCYHMMEVFGNPGHAALWSAAADGVPVDWDALFEGYGATVDWPSTFFWEELADHYPDAKIVLSVRDPEGWYTSVSNTIYRAMTAPQESLPPPVAEQLAMARKIVLERSLEGRFEDRAYAIEVFERHAEAVKRAIPPERLLVYPVGAGWEPLCTFLDRPIPDSEYPRSNSTEEFRERFAVVEG